MVLRMEETRWMLHTKCIFKNILKTNNLFYEKKIIIKIQTCMITRYALLSESRGALKVSREPYHNVVKLKPIHEKLIFSI